MIRKENNCGSALLMVILAILFFGLLGSMLAAATVLHAKLEGYYQAERESFYTADGILEEIRSGLSGYSSEAAMQGYEYTLLHYIEINDAGKNEQEVFSEKYLSVLKEKLEEPGETGYYAIDSIKGLLKGSEEEKACVQILEGKNLLVRPEGESCLLLKNVRIVTIGEREIETVLTTDIHIEAPSLEMVKRKSFVEELLSYTLLGEKGINLENTSVIGSVYGGRAENSETGIFLKGTGLLGSSIQGNIILSRGELLAEGGRSFLCGKGETPEDSSIWLKNIRLEGGNTCLSLHGSVNVADDIEINGNQNQLKLKGSYFGFGAETAQAKYSSAIMINGRSARIDLTELDTLLLAGNSFIKKSGGAAFEEEVPQENSDILLGSSLSVKSDQLVYFVPERYIDLEEQGEITFHWEEYAEYVGIEREAKSLLNATQPVTAYYYRRLLGTGADQLDCYYFLNFKNTESAVRFYRLYAEANAELIKNNSAAYLAEGQAISLKDGLLYTSSGELMYREDSQEALSWLEANVTEKGRSLLEERCKRRAREYLSRQLYLVPDAYVSGEWLPEDAATLLSAFIDQSKLEAMFSEAASGSRIYSYPEIPEGKIYIVGAEGLDTEAAEDFDTRRGILLSLGDVKLSGQFQGMVIAFGSISGENAEIESDAVLVEKLMRAEAAKYESLEAAEAAGSFLSLFHGINLQYLWEEEQQSVDLSSYITYERWRKNGEE